ncbi:FRG domain-containing protein [Burkholderia sp. DN3021]|uniref:FRG domain-containing protein n=1 Tax=Burkholderia sp. DN3021 TaxID=3410137 RepID=UPI003C7DF131
MTDCDDYCARQHLGDVTTLADYIAAITQHLNGATRYLYRGHRDASWKLLPSVARYALSDLNVERAMLDEFKRRAIPYLESHLDLQNADWLPALLSTLLASCLATEAVVCKLT